MKDFFGALAGLWYGGIFVSLFVYSWRCGLGWNVANTAMSAWMHVPSRRNGIPWLFMTLGKAFAWPLVLGIWLRAGRPAPSLLFHSSAAAALGRPHDDLPYAERGFATKWSFSKNGPAAA